MKIKMGISPRNPEQAEKRYWAVGIIRAFGILQILGGAGIAFFFLTPSMALLLASTGMAGETAAVLSLVLSVALGIFAGCALAAMTFATAAAFDDLHAIRGYLRDLTITGQYYDE